MMPMNFGRRSAPRRVPGLLGASQPFPMPSVDPGMFPPGASMRGPNRDFNFDPSQAQNLPAWNTPPGQPPQMGGELPPYQPPQMGGELPPYQPPQMGGELPPYQPPAMMTPPPANNPAMVSPGNPGMQNRMRPRPPMQNLGGPVARGLRMRGL